jgi:lipopolysaccharide/colanic/teichoic acid biosynthesis glycosyltransferase
MMVQGWLRQLRTIGTDAGKPQATGAGAPRWLGSLARLSETVAAERLDLLVLDDSDLRRVLHHLAGAEGSESQVAVCDLGTFREEALEHAPDTSRASPGRLGTATKRVFDVLVATPTLIAALPLLLVLIWLIRRDGGPAFFKQTRIGRDGEPFTLYKLRTMGPDCYDDEWCAVNDPRLTRLGRKIRRVHLDELPQLLNVVLGDMSLVGPRPEQPHYVQSLRRIFSFYDVRHQVPPGMTGWAQVCSGYARSEADSGLKLSHDLHYVRNRSNGMDLVIIGHTIRILMRSLFTTGEGPRLDHLPPDPTAGGSPVLVATTTLTGSDTEDGPRFLE